MNNFSILWDYGLFRKHINISRTPNTTSTPVKWENSVRYEQFFITKLVLYFFSGRSARRQAHAGEPRPSLCCRLSDLLTTITMCPWLLCRRLSAERGRGRGSVPGQRSLQVVQHADGLRLPVHEQQRRSSAGAAARRVRPPGETLLLFNACGERGEGLPDLRHLLKFH